MSSFILGDKKTFHEEEKIMERNKFTQEFVDEDIGNRYLRFSFKGGMITKTMEFACCILVLFPLYDQLELKFIFKPDWSIETFLGYLEVSTLCLN